MKWNTKNIQGYKKQFYLYFLDLLNLKKMEKCLASEVNAEKNNLF